MLLMPEVTALFWDIGGVILTNGWDRAGRQAAVKKFGLDWEEFEDRHDLANAAWEMGQITLDEYLTRTVFYRSPKFTREEFKAFIFEQSRALPESREILDGLTRGGRYLLAALNNEALEVNLYRIDRFDLRRNFSAFFSSCFVGMRKPDLGIYKLALEVTQRPAEQCIFIDDRALNLECAAKLGMRTIVFQNATQLRQDLERSGVTLNGR
jgi:putative hydrolase of the HAD superfamily